MLPSTRGARFAYAPNAIPNTLCRLSPLTPTHTRRFTSSLAGVCGADTPFPLAMEKIYLPDEIKVYDAIKRTVHF